MKISSNANLSLVVIFSLLSLAMLTPAPIFAQQEESPLPGAGIANDNTTTPAADPATANSAPIPGNMDPVQDTDNNKSVQSGTVSSHMVFSAPLSLAAIQTLVQDLKKGSTTEENLNKYLVWLDTLIKAHNKLANAFSKQESMSAACTNERNLSKQLYPIKDQVLYLKAQLLIKQNRWPEAMTILVDIIAVEPQSALGQQAYQRLIETGFSPELTDHTVKTISSKSRRSRFM